MTWGETFTVSVPLLVVFGLMAGIVGLLIWKKKWLAAILVAIVAGLLFAIALPSYFPARGAAQRATCINNMAIISEAKRSWAAADGKSTNNAPTIADLGLFLKHGEVPKCPTDGGAYSLGRVGENPRCPNEKSRGHVLP
jgi:hypothetical protein